MITRRRLLASVSATTLVVLAGASLRNAQSAQSMSIHAGTANGQWRSYGGDLASTRYAPLDQINRDNFTKLEVAWRFKTDSFGPRPEINFEGTPLMVGGKLYSTVGTRRVVVALDAATGELLWTYREDEGPRGEAAPRRFSGRGLAYWSEGADERILYVTPGYRLIALDAKTGRRVPGFGTNGVVDLKLEQRSEHGSRQRRDRTSRSTRRRPQCHRRRRRASLRRHPEADEQREGLHPRLRRAHRQASVDLPHHSAARRIRQRHLGTGILCQHRQCRRVGSDVDR